MWSILALSYDYYYYDDHNEDGDDDAMETRKRKPEKMCSGKRGKSAMAVEGVKSEIMKIPNPSDENPTTSERQTPGRTQHYARIARKLQFFTGGEGMSIDILETKNSYKLKF